MMQLILTKREEQWQRISTNVSIVLTKVSVPAEKWITHPHHGLFTNIPYNGLFTNIPLVGFSLTCSYM
jgi:hypothetical protein